MTAGGDAAGMDIKPGPAKGKVEGVVVNEQNHRIPLCSLDGMGWTAREVASSAKAETQKLRGIGVQSTTVAG
jgi:hypothetical protein